MFNDPINSLFNTSFDQTERGITNLIDSVQAAYTGADSNQSKVLAEITRSSLVGSFTVFGSYEALLEPRDLNYKLRSRDLFTQMSLAGIRDNTYAYTASIYGSMGLNPPQTQSYAGYTANSLSLINGEARIRTQAETELQNPAQSSRVLGGTLLADPTVRLLADDSPLVQGMRSLEAQLSQDFGIKIQVETISDKAGVPERIRVKVPNIEVLDGAVLRQSDERDALRSSSKVFEFAPTRLGGVLELPTNRYIGESYLGDVRQSAVETAVGFVRTYVLQQEILLDHSVSLAFRQFLQDQHTYNPAQSYLELDKYLGSILSKNQTFTEYLNTVATSGDVTTFLQVQADLAKALKLNLPADRFSQVSGVQLASIYTTGIERVLKPLGSRLDTRAMSQQVIRNLAEVLLDPQIAEDVRGDTVRVDAFTSLKQNILTFSQQGNILLRSKYNAMLREQMYSGRKNLLEQLRAPFMQPHESNFSGAQQLARVAYYAPDQSSLTQKAGANRTLSSYLQLGGVYKHGSGNIAIGSVYIPISAQSSNMKIYEARYHDAQLESASRETVSFYDLKTLFSGNRQLAATSLGQFRQDLGGYKQKDRWLQLLQDSLDVKDEDQLILIMPFRKPEQIPQRLKNLSGTRPANEYSLRFYQALMNQEDLSQYFDSNGLSLNRAAAASGSLNTILPQLQYSQLQELQELATANNMSVTEVARILDANPLAEIRGFATNSKMKRLLIGTGANQLSDYMHLNSAHVAYYGYEQFTKIELEAIQSYDPIGGKLYASNINLDQQRQQLQRIFAPGHRIYYQAVKLQHSSTLEEIKSFYNQVLNYYEPGSDKERVFADPNVRKAVAQRVKQRYNYIQGIDAQFKDGALNLDITLKRGLYGIENDRLIQHGVFDADSSRLFIGLKPTVNERGEYTQVRRMTVKISGNIRSNQEGAAIINDLLEFNHVDGRLTGHISSTILFNGSVRPGIENIKGPSRYDDPELFDYYDQNAPTYTLSERTRVDNPIYGIASSASLKGFNYESGLDVLSTSSSYEAFKARLAQSPKLATALFATYFAADLSSLAKDEKTKTLLSQRAKQLQSLIRTTLESSEDAEFLQSVIKNIGKNKTLTKNANLFVNNSGLFSLLGGASDYTGMGLNAPLGQLQEVLISSLYSNNDVFFSRMVGLFDTARAQAFNEAGYLTFDQGSSVVRAASVVSSLVGQTFYTLDYAKNRRRNEPLSGSILELNLIDQRTGRVNIDVVLGKHHAATMDLLQRAHARIPRADKITKLRADYQKALKTIDQAYRERQAEYKEAFNPELFNRDTYFQTIRRDQTYRQLEEQLSNLYAQSQSSIPLMWSVILAPSKILQAAGSKDTASLEYHYSIAMSKRQVDKMRGYVSDPNELTEISAAYRMLVRAARSGSLEQIRFMSPFLGAQTTQLYRTVIAGLEHATALNQSLNIFGRQQAQSLFSNYASLSLAATLDPRYQAQLSDFQSRLKLLTETVTFNLGSTDLQLQARARALAMLLNQNRRLPTRPKPTTIPPANLSPSDKFVFFDIETGETNQPHEALIDQRYPESDPRRYPSKAVSEITFIFGSEDGAEILSWAQKDSKGVSRKQFLQEVAAKLRGDFNTAFLVGHNIRSFDVPTLAPLFAELDPEYQLDLTNRRLIDTLHDVDRAELKARLGTSKHNLESLYKAVTLITTGIEESFKSHVAEEDVKANIAVFKYIVEENLFKQPKAAPFVSTVQRPDALLFSNDVTYFDAASNTSHYQLVRGITAAIYENSNRSHLGWFYENYRDRLLTGLRRDYHGRAEVIIKDVEELLFKAMSANGTFAVTRDRETNQVTQTALFAYLDRIALESDRALEKKIESALYTNESTYIDSLEQQALAYKNLEVQYRLGNNIEAATKAGQMFDIIHSSRSVILPLLNFEDLGGGKQRAFFVKSTADPNKVLLNSGLLYLGTDILRHLPKEFEDFVPKIVRHRRELDYYLPQYFDLIERIQQGNNVISQGERELLTQMEVLAVQNRTLIYEALGGTLAQRAFGEKTKTTGISSTTVASYLLEIDQVALGDRFTSVLGQKALARIAAHNKTKYNQSEVLVLRAGGPSGASQLDQTYKVVSLKELHAEAVASNSLTRINPVRNSTTSLIPIFGRFSAQGGDFDGDSYAIIGRYENELNAYADLLDAKRDIERSKKRINNRLYADENYFTKQISQKLAHADVMRQAAQAEARNELKVQIGEAMDLLKANDPKQPKDSFALAKLIWQLENPQTKLTLKDDFITRISGEETEEIKVGARHPLLNQFTEIESLFRLGDSRLNVAAYTQTFKSMLGMEFDYDSSRIGQITQSIHTSVVKSDAYRSIALQQSPFTGIKNLIAFNQSQPATSGSNASVSVRDMIVWELQQQLNQTGIHQDRAQLIQATIADLNRTESTDQITFKLLQNKIKRAEENFILLSQNLETATGRSVSNQAQELFKNAYLQKLKQAYYKSYLLANYDAIKAGLSLEEVPSREISPEEMVLRAQAKEEEARALYHELRANEQHKFNYLYGTVTRDEIDFVENRLSQLEAQERIINEQIKTKEAGISRLLGQTHGVAEKADASMRRHVAAYTGIPFAYLSAEANIFTSAEAFNMIEQHRGVTPSLEDFSGQNLKGNRNQRLTKVVSAFNSSLYSSQQTQVVSTKTDLLNQFVNQFISSVEDQDLKDIFNDALRTDDDRFKFIWSSGQQRLNMLLEYAEEGDAIVQALATNAKIIANAGGTTLNNKAFHALQATIGSSGTNLIGEAYNAVTILMAKTIFSRSISEAFSKQPLNTGIDRADVSSHDFLEVTKQSLMALFPAGGDWEQSLDSKNIKKAKDFLLETFNNSAGFQQAAFNRAQALTGLLANVQQSVRDSLKQKVEGGMLQSIMSEPVVEDNTMYAILTNASATQEERLPALRKFLAEDAGAGLFSPPKERKFTERYKITAFGAMFLLNDFLSGDANQIEKMIHGRISRDDEQVQAYRFLKERFEYIRNLEQTENQGRYTHMLDSQYFIAQSIVDLLAMSTAERSVYQAAFKGGEEQDAQLTEMRKIRELTRAAFIRQEKVGGFSADTLQVLRNQYQIKVNRKRETEHQQNIAQAFFFDARTGRDLLETKSQRIQAAQSLGMSEADAILFASGKDKDAAFDFWQRASVNFIYNNNKQYGMTVDDLMSMKETAEAIKFLRFGSIEGNTTFRGFVNQSAAAIEGLLIQSMRDQIEDPRHRAEMSFEAGAQLFAAMHDVRNRITDIYGDVDLGEKNNIPLEVLEAYTAAERVAGIFNQMYADNLSPDVKAHAEQMFGMALARKDKDGNSGWLQLSYLLSGLNQIYKNQRLLMEAQLTGEEASEDVKQMHAAYMAAYNQTVANDNTQTTYSEGAVGPTEPTRNYTAPATNNLITSDPTPTTPSPIQTPFNDPPASPIGSERPTANPNPVSIDPATAPQSQGSDDFTTTLLRDPNHKSNAVVDFAIQLGTKQHAQTLETESQNTIDDSAEANKRLQAQRHSTISAFIGPAVGLLLATGKADNNIIDHGYNILQAASQVAEMGEHRRWNSAAMFQISRLQQTVYGEGAVFGAAKGVASEVLFEAVSRASHRALKSDQKGGGRSYLAELGSSLIGLIISSAMTDRKYGPLEEDEKDYQQTALLSLPGLAIGLAESMVEEFLESTRMPTDFDSDIEYEVSTNLKEVSVRDLLSMGWLNRDPYGEEGSGQMDEEVG